MCGIVGIVGNSPVSDRLLDALKRLEYRGYDSAGIATVQSDGRLDRRRALGKLAELESVLHHAPLDGQCGIGHTRWATHGIPSEANAHPHMAGRVAVVHNGIIENFKALRTDLDQADTLLEGQTDTEIITHLLDQLLAKGMPPFDAFQALLTRLQGAFALGVIVRGDDNLMFAARRGSPLVIGIGEGETYLGSDALALAPLTNQLIYLEEGDSAALTQNSIQIFNSDGQPAERPVTISQASSTLAAKGNHRHFMQKEIFEQPTVIAQTLAHYVDYAQSQIQVSDFAEALSHISRVKFIACGTAFYAGQVARYWCEHYAKVPSDADIASEFRYRDPVFAEQELIVFISQSGETADTLAALKLAKEKGQKTLAVVNVPESSIAREADYILPTFAGPEIGVASTKAFTCQLAVLAVFTLKLAHLKSTISDTDLTAHIDELQHLPAEISNILMHDQKLAAIGEMLAPVRDTLFVGRGIHFPIAMEGALKLKEISYIHAEGYAAGELKHGPIALVDDKTPVIGIAPSHALFDKTVSNLEEIEARKGKVIVLSDQKYSDDPEAWIEMPASTTLVSPILYAVPVQLIAYYTAVAKGTDVDQPRNLAKSVTVE